MENFLMELLGFALALIFALGGMVVHFYKRLIRGEAISGDLIDYIFHFNPAATRRALFTTLIAVVTMWGTGQVLIVGGESFTLAGLLSYFLAGYAIDSAFNSEKGL